MSRRVVFAGGTQTRALARVYRGEVAAHTGEDVVFIGTGAIGTDAARSTLLMADVVVMETDEDGDAIPADSLPGQAHVIRVPNLYCDFLWPFAGRSHPRNRGAFALPGGPYPAEHGDRFLDQMAADGVYETTAIMRYKAIDIAAEGELDSRLADRSAILARLDAAAGYDLAPFIIERFRAEPLFRTRQRLSLPLVARLVNQLFAKMGVAGWHEGSLRRVPFPAGAQPIHPGVIAHFGLAWATPASRYPVNEEGFFTFEEFCRRYMGFVWNEALHRGIQTAKTDLAGAREDLERGLAESPDSPLGRLALAASRAADGPADPGLILDEDSYDPAAEAAASPLAEPAQSAPILADEPEAALLAEAAPPAPAVEDTRAPGEPETGAASPTDEDELIAEAAPAPASPRASPPAEVPAPVEQPVRVLRPGQPGGPKPGSIADGFTDFRPAAAPLPAVATPGSDLIDALPSLLPVFADLTNNVDRPFDTMPEVMPPPPLRPILPPELQDEGPRPGLLARMLGRR